jgi:hypothetical protein
VLARKRAATPAPKKRLPRRSQEWAQVDNPAFAKPSMILWTSSCLEDARPAAALFHGTASGPGRGWESLRQGKSPLIARSRACKARARHGVQSVQDYNAGTLAVLDIPPNTGTVLQKNPWQGGSSRPGQIRNGARVWRAMPCGWIEA